jgi:hypothetical protein
MKENSQGSFYARRERADVPSMIKWRLNEIAVRRLAWHTGDAF